MSGTVCNGKQPLLSICIPTYNRCEYLREALINITSDKDFDDRIEIIISDNASTDDTLSVCESFSSKYDNILYSRNEINIKDQNFFLVLSKANGKYIRLFNDTLRFNFGMLGQMLNIIEYSSEDSFLFFYQNVKFLHVNKCIAISNTGQFINNTSFYVTWIGNFGCWRKDLDLINKPNFYAELQLNQVDWSLQLVSKKNDGSIYFDDYFTSIIPDKKGGYNMFEVFIDNYLLILRSHFKGHENFFRIEKEKYLLYRYQILPWCVRLFGKDREKYTFSTSNAKAYLIKEYWYYPYFYLGLIGLFLYNIRNKSICYI